MAELAKKVTSADVRAALKLRYPAASHALMFEVAPTTGGGTRYADAVSVGLWASHGHRIEGIEVKVSRADFLNELKQPEKSQPVFEFCSAWWLACPKDMVKPDELPPTWGLLELMDNGTLRVRVKAPKLEPRPPTLGFFAALCRRRAGLDEEMSDVKLRAALTVQTTELKQRMDSERSHQFSHELQQAQEGLKVLKQIKAETGIDLMSYRRDDYLKAVRLLESLGGERWDRASLSGLVNSARQLLVAIEGSGLAPEGRSDG